MVKIAWHSWFHDSCIAIMIRVGLRSDATNQIMHGDIVRTEEADALKGFSDTG